MNNAVSINSKKFLGRYIDARNDKRNPEDLFLYTGVILSLALPQLAFYIYGGPLPLLAFAASALTGVLLGLARYRSPYRPPLCVAGAVARVPPHNEALRQRAS